MTFDYDRKIFEYFESLKRYVISQPLLLGGVSNSGGGAGGPPAGFIGYLPQNRVTYDYLEASSSGITTSGPTLLDNLNHIRYRLSAVESGVAQGKISVSLSGVELSDDVRVLDFQGDVKVTVSGTTAVVDTGTFYLDDLSSQLDGVKVVFGTENRVINNTVQLYYNGLHQLPTDYSIISGGNAIQTTFTPANGAKLVASYKYFIPSTVTGWGTAPWGTADWGI